MQSKLFQNDNDTRYSTFMTFICAIPKIYETESSTELFKKMYSMMMNRVNYSETSYTVTSFFLEMLPIYFNLGYTAKE